eukprot:CAMPEP_0198258576 /NCGR_PEP_ID=MMETSP1447-20131203/7958_1 /TAXON_ID=420782 /ORGANISM="Chaetoceros dichaeta, Strain CCMP1751" /LENGTH=377 /DNA_ID=CAMNT_0043945721 /DNA_START=148 /DNA_END=1281 /DNA_ORIENTATION=-
MTTTAAAATSSATSKNKDDDTPSVRIVCYNVLSSQLARTDHFSKTPPSHLDASNRLPKVLAKIEEECRIASSKSLPVIFCLQEVSLDWVGEFHAFFAERGYHFVPANYGGKFGGYMGIATAYPTEHYETLKVDITRLSDKRIGGWPPSAPPPSTIRRYVLNPLKQTLSTILMQEKEVKDVWSYSKNRYNQFIAIRLRQRRRKTDDDDRKDTVPFWIGNYHMPCAFRDPPVMNIHAEMVSKRIQTLATTENDAYILAGDFNLKPDSAHYRLLTEGAIKEDDATYPPPKFGIEWESTIAAMRSAYATYGGKEPEFTNFALTEGMGEPFVETLDYIFLSDEWEVTDVKPVPRLEDVDGPLPNEIEPSDHVVIATDLKYSI